MSKSDVRPFSDKEYSLLVLRALKRLARRSEWIREAVPPRQFEEDEASGREIAEALQFAIDAVRAPRGNEE
jgi:hypothetical protein